MNQQRTALWDNVRFFLILSVVLGHFAEPYVKQLDIFRFLFLFFYSFHMPMFLFLSGVFFKNKNIKEKVMGYLAIYVVLKIVNGAVKYLTGNNYVFTLFTEDGIPWFMLTMAVYTGLTHLLQGLNKRFVFFLALAVGCFSGYDKDIGDFLVLSRSIVYYPFFLLGTMVNREKLEQAAAKPALKITAFVLLCGIAAFFYMDLDRLYALRPFFTGRNPFPKAYLAIGTPIRIQCYLITSVIGLTLILAAPCRRLPLVTAIGSKTLQIYFWHNMIRRALVFWGVGTFFLSFGPLGIALWLLCGTVLTFLFALPIFSFPTAQLLKAPYAKPEGKPIGSGSCEKQNS